MSCLTNKITTSELRNPWNKTLTLSIVYRNTFTVSLVSHLQLLVCYQESIVHTISDRGFETVTKNTPFAR